MLPRLRIRACVLRARLRYGHDYTLATWWNVVQLAAFCQHLLLTLHR